LKQGINGREILSLLMDVIDNLADTKLEGPYLSLSFSRIRRRDQADIACSAA